MRGARTQGDHGRSPTDERGAAGSAKPWAFIADATVRCLDALVPLLERCSFRVRAVATGRTDKARPISEADVVLINVSGVDADVRKRYEWWRARTGVPCIGVSTHSTSAEAIVVLESGMDDYLGLPMNEREFVARLRRRLGEAVDAPPGDAVARRDFGRIMIVADGLQIDLRRLVAQRDGEIIHLSRTEWGILRALIAAGGRLLTHRALFDAVWQGREGNPQYHLRVHVANIRRKIEREPRQPELIVTHTGIGYRYAGPLPRGR